MVDPRFRNSEETVIVGRGYVGSQSRSGVSCHSNTATLLVVDWLGHSVSSRVQTPDMRTHIAIVSDQEM